MSNTDIPTEDEKREKLIEYRNSIDNIDAAVINMLAERFKITQKVGVYKAKYGLPPADKDRESKQIARLRKLSENAQLDPDFSEKFLDFIIEEVIHHHKKIRGGE
ncbi:MAG: chorismate mutase [Kordiimonadaceae bacterium]|nr:chorismate mutase [Kordiimonadaceae bacterium]MBT6035738.1 chorismate mutase [Kordiimonadaceae bacterium]MBT6329433.1 chorismate mutase [Kordiimonadaceae bacterium]